MRMGLVGNTIYYGGIIGIFGYLGWEIWNLGKNMPQIEEDHPVNEIFQRRRKEIRAKTTRDQPLTRFEKLTDDRIPADPSVPVKKEDEGGYM